MGGRMTERGAVDPTVTENTYDRFWQSLWEAEATTILQRDGKRGFAERDSASSTFPRPHLSGGDGFQIALQAARAEHARLAAPGERGSWPGGQTPSSPERDAQALKLFAELVRRKPNVAAEEIYSEARDVAPDLGLNVPFELLPPSHRAAWQTLRSALVRLTAPTRSLGPTRKRDEGRGRRSEFAPAHGTSAPKRGPKLAS